MNKKTKLFFTLGTVGAIPLVAIAAVSCSDKLTLGEKIGDVKLQNDAKKITPVNKRTSIIITDAGKITDKSFNQSAFEGAFLAADQHDIATRSFLSTVEPTSDADISRQYQTAQSNGFKNWILPGFKHSETIKKYWTENKEALKTNKVVVIGTDFVPEVDEGHGIGVEFDVKDSAFVVGYAAADYLAKKYPSDADKRSVFAFGGAVFDGVTSFIRGFYKGIEQFNKENKDKKTKILSTNINLASDFVVGNTMNAVITTAISSNATIILPVAGPATVQVIDTLKKGDAHKHKLVVGVDVDQAQSNPADKKWFFSSIIKRIAQANYDIQTELYGKEDDYKIIKGFKLGEKSIKILGNFDNNLVGYASSSLEGDEKTSVDNSLQKGKQEFDKIKSSMDTVFETSTYNDAVNNKNGQSTTKYLTELANKINAIG